MKNTPDFSNAKIDDVVYYLNGNNFYEGKVVELHPKYSTIGVLIPDKCSFRMLFTYKGTPNIQLWEPASLFWKPFDIPEESLTRPKEKEEEGEELFVEIMAEEFYGYYFIRKIIPGSCISKNPEYLKGDHLIYDAIDKRLMFFKEEGDFVELIIGENTQVEEDEWIEICTSIESAKNCYVNATKKSIKKHVEEKPGEEKISWKW